MKPRIMYVENKATGEAHIGRVSFSKTGRTVYYNSKSLSNLGGRGFKANHYDIDTHEEYWVSGPHKDGNDKLYGGQKGVVIDADVWDEYWIEIRGLKEIPKR
jgi:hypothetical protein